MNKRPFLGADLRLNYLSEAGMFEDADLATTNRLKDVISEFTQEEGLRKQRDVMDLERTSGEENIAQSLVNRIKTGKGQLTSLGHPEYGSRIHELIGELNTETNRSLVKLHILEAMSHEARIETISRLDVQTSPSDPTRVDVHLEIKIIDIPNPLSLVVPFYFEGRS
ncbi:MAG: GPW/gp25 family protein [Candidatus Hodarchaeota archaeon]